MKVSWFLCTGPIGEHQKVGCVQPILIFKGEGWIKNIGINFTRVIQLMMI